MTKRKIFPKLKTQFQQEFLQWAECVPFENVSHSILPVWKSKWEKMCHFLWLGALNAIKRGSAGFKIIFSIRHFYPWQIKFNWFPAEWCAAGCLMREGCPMAGVLGGRFPWILGMGRWFSFAHLCHTNCHLESFRKEELSSSLCHPINFLFHMCGQKHWSP